mmetsp:Transcript_11012/g.15569  ORF Transcript_11012/g.15569 Transcript_11012/m.15569 type:complete len:81 (-) Transcript_11012:1-243(-)
MATSKQEQSPAYKALHDAGLIVNTYKVGNVDELHVVAPNSSVEQNLSKRGMAYVLGLGVGGIAYDCVIKQFSVRAGWQGA